VYVLWPELLSWLRTQRVPLPAQGSENHTQHQLDNCESDPHEDAK
jgi:hypothetical protein